MQLILLSVAVNFLFKNVLAKNMDSFSFVYFELNSKQMTRVWQLRHFHRPQINYAIPYYFIAKILADKDNVSTIRSKTWNDPKVLDIFARKPAMHVSYENETTIVGFAGLFYYTTYNPLFQWKRFQSFPNKPIYVMVEMLKWNFIYCDMPSWRKEPVWSMNMFTKAFNFTTWLCIVLTMLGFCLTLGLKNFALHMLSTLSIMVCSGLGGTIEGKRILFPVYCILNQVLSNLYSVWELVFTTMKA